MDNVSVHKVAGVREAIEARGAILLYLPPYSPDLNPIEQFFSKLKALLRKVAARSIDSLWEVIGSCLADFSPSECAAYLTHAGYGRRDGQPYRKVLCIPLPLIGRANEEANEATAIHCRGLKTDSQLLAPASLSSKPISTPDAPHPLPLLRLRHRSPCDPLADGLVGSVPRPGGNLTGFMSWDNSIAGKFLASLIELAASVKRAAIMLNPEASPARG